MANKTGFISFLRELAPYVVVVGSFARNEEHGGSDIDCFLRSRPISEVDQENSADCETYMPEVLALIKQYQFISDSIIVGHIAVERQFNIPRMIEISSHYKIPFSNPVTVREIYGVPFLCAVDNKEALFEECYDCAEWDEKACEMVIEHPLPSYAEKIKKS